MVTKFFAACRNPDGARELWEVESDYEGKCVLVKCDVTSEEEVAKAAEAVGKGWPGRAH